MAGNTPACDHPEPLLEEEGAEQLTERITGYMAGAATTNMITLADSLGVFKYMAGRPAETSQQIADGMGLSERWIRELLFQLATARIVSTSKDASKFWLTAAQAATTAYEEGPDASPLWVIGSCISLCEGARSLPDLQRCFKTGLGMKYDDYGQGMACGVCRELSVWTRHNLLSHIAKIDGLHERLEAGATVADVGCGYGLALQLLAERYPKSTFHGYDISTYALDGARELVSGLPNVKLFNPANAEERMRPKTYDFAMTLDAIHDMAQPEPVLAAVRDALKDDATGYLVVDFRSTGDPARNMSELNVLSMLGYSYSVMLCMSSALSEPGGKGLGTLGWHPQLAKAMMKEAGFSGVEELEWESELNLFYLARV